MAENLIKDLIRVKTARTHARLTRLKLFEAFGVPAGLLAFWVFLVVSGGFAYLPPVGQALCVSPGAPDFRAGRPPGGYQCQHEDLLGTPSRPAEVCSL